MNKHIEDAMEIRNEQPMVCNCAQTILRVYAKELGLSPEQAEKLGSNFGGGMKCGGTRDHKRAFGTWRQRNRIGC